MSLKALSSLSKGWRPNTIVTPFYKVHKYAESFNIVVHVEKNMCEKGGGNGKKSIPKYIFAGQPGCKTLHFKI